MGSGRWSDSDWKDYTTTRGYSKKKVEDIYAKNLHKDLDPKRFSLRESRDSKDNPNSNAIILGLDVTGSMGSVLNSIAKEGLKTLVSEIYKRQPVKDPHVMCMGIGDVECDDAPLQVTQFEADLRIAKELEKIWLEMGGGGNSYESYSLAWYYAATHTSTDCYEKRSKKGYLFTFGDELPTAILHSSDIERAIGVKPQMDKISSEDLYRLVSKKWEVFHIIIGQGHFASVYHEEVRSQWSELLGQNAIWLSDYTKLAEVIVSLIQVREGEDKVDVARSWDKSTSLVVRDAITSVESSNKVNDDNGIVML